MRSVTIGIPTYDRPSELSVALRSATNQRYANLRILVSDNASPGSATRDCVESFKQIDPRVIYHRQPHNIGATKNFAWLLNHADSDAFIWLADDDEFEGDDHIQRLMNTLVKTGASVAFPDIHEVDAEQRLLNRNVLAPFFSGCESDFSYLLAWCAFGGGHPIYGLFDTTFLRNAELERRLKSNWAYFSEGIFLHTLFCRGGLRFCPQATLLYNSVNGTRNIRSRKLFATFLLYSFEVHYLYATSRFSLNEKRQLYKRLHDSHWPYIKSLGRKAWLNQLGG